ncbi:hypothetical protein [Streptomyces capitiformicae]|uniref:hypothetical protein n=1 Tax=Streptomyces capitiformicae TaxID=2014920 RepID=UPI001E379D7F|nr:hypothetical protein [Streptomyces capitiformicae]
MCDDRAASETPHQSNAAAKPVRWAADTVSTIREGARLRLDHWATSLWHVDRMIDALRREATPYPAMESVLRGFGAYAGEVIVRQAGGEWWSAGGDHGIRTVDGRLWNPLDEARRCLSGQGSLRLLCRDATAGAPEPRDQRPR